MRFCLGDSVVTQDGTALGTVSRILLDSGTSQVLGIIIGRSDQLSLDTFVPVDMLLGETGNQMTMLASTERAKQMAGYRGPIGTFRTPGSTTSREDVTIGSSPTSGLPAVSHIVMEMADQITATCIDGQAGRLCCLLTDQYTNTLTSIALQDVPGTSKLVTVPLAWVSNLGSRPIQLGCTLDQLQHLPEPAPGLYIPVEGQPSTEIQDQQ